MSNLGVPFAVTSVGYNSTNEGAYAALDDAFQIALNSGTLFFAAAGNNNGGSVIIPARFEAVVAVSALERDGGSFVIAPFSSVGSQVELSAPGASVRVSWNRDNDDWLAFGTRRVDGTSFAAPLAMGVARLLAAANPSWSVHTIRQEMRDHALDLGTPGHDSSFGYGMVDAPCVVQQVTSCTR